MIQWLILENACIKLCKLFFMCHKTCLWRVQLKVMSLKQSRLRHLVHNLHIVTNKVSSIKYTRLICYNDLMDVFFCRFAPTCTMKVIVVIHY